MRYGAKSEGKQVEAGGCTSTEHCRLTLPRDFSTLSLYSLSTLSLLSLYSLYFLSALSFSNGGIDALFLLAGLDDEVVQSNAAYALGNLGE